MLYAMPTKFNSSLSSAKHKNSILYHSKGTFVSEGRDIRFAKFMPMSTVSFSYHKVIAVLNLVIIACVKKAC